MTTLAVSYFFLLIVIVVAVLWVGVLIANFINKQAGSMVRLLVLVPQGLINPLDEHRKGDTDLSEELYRRLGELKIPFVLETAVPGVGEEIHFYISVPRFRKRDVCRLIQTLWRSGHVTDATDSESWHVGLEGAVLKTGYFEQARPYSIPIALAHKGHFEPFAGILRLLSKLEPLAEGSAIQWVVRPADPRITSDIGALLQELHDGKFHISKHFHETFVITPENLKLIEQKIKQPLFFVNGRIAAMSRDETKAHAILHEIADHHSMQISNQLNHLKLVEPKQPEKAFASFLSQSFDEAQTMVLSSQELATLFHLPGPTTPIPKIRRH